MKKTQKYTNICIEKYKCVKYKIVCKEYIYIYIYIYIYN